MNQCILIPENIVQQALKNYNLKTGSNFTCVWPQDSELGIYLRDFEHNLKLDYQKTYMLLRQLLTPLGYNIDGCDAIYYTSSKYYIVVWNQE